MAYATPSSAQDVCLGDELPILATTAVPRSSGQVGLPAKRRPPMSLAQQNCGLDSMRAYTYEPKCLGEMRFLSQKVGRVSFRAVADVRSWCWQGWAGEEREGEVLRAAPPGVR